MGETVIPAQAHCRQLSAHWEKNGHEELEEVTKGTKKSAADAKEIKENLRPEPCRSYESHPLVAHEET